MSSPTYAFFGNRAFVLEAMLEADLDVAHIGAVAGSYLEKYLQQHQLDYTAVKNKTEFFTWLNNIKADRFITNGCPYIIPADMLSMGIQFINIHPSYLPDLRGADPVPGALLYGRDSGATCHVMDAGIDTGDIIAQVKIPYDGMLDAPLLYQLSFKAEADVFAKALALDFKPQYAQKEIGNEIAYTRQDEDLLIDLDEEAEAICRRVRAFANKSQLARFEYKGSLVKVKAAQILHMPYLALLYEDLPEDELFLLCEDSFVIKTNEGFLRLYSAE